MRPEKLFGAIHGACCLCLIVLLLCLAGMPCFGQDKSAEAQNAPSASVPERTPNPDKTENDRDKDTAAPRYQNTLGKNFLKNLALDQKAIWTSPAKARSRDTRWLVPMTAVLAGLVATDTDVSNKFANRPSLMARSNDFAKVGVGLTAITAGGFYLSGRISGNEHTRETGFLASESLLDGLVVAEALKFATGRERPFQRNGKGAFLAGGSSFPSEHSMAAWSVASVIAHEYPGTLTKVLAYGAASAIGFSRISGRQHFPSDVFIGSALGWLIGRQVYRAHHDPELPGSSWGTFDPTSGDERTYNPSMMGSPYVPLESWVYSAFDRLAALGYVQTGFAGLRPWTRLECARLLGEAAELLEAEHGTQPNQVQRLYAALEAEFIPEQKLRAGGRNLDARIDSAYTRVTGISGKALTDGYHFSQTIVNDYGRPYQEGTNISGGVSASAVAGPFVFHVTAEYQHAPAADAMPGSAREAIAYYDGTAVLPPAPFQTVDRVRLLDSYVAMTVKDWQLSFGKQSLWWGPGQSGPMMISNNAEPIVMLRVARATPFTLPSFFRWMGPVRTEFFVGQLSGHDFMFSVNKGLMGPPARIDPQPFINGQKISFKPTPNLEFGVSKTALFAGMNAPFTARTFFNSIFNPANANPGTVDEPGDRRTGFDFSYRIPKLRKWLILYNDAVAEDEISPIAYPRRSAMNPGIYMPQLPGLPKVDFRLEAAYTDLPNLKHVGFFYWNGGYRSGYTNEGDLLANWVSRDGRGIQAWSTFWWSPQTKVQVGYRNHWVDPEFMGGGNVNNWTLRTEFPLRSGVQVSAFVQYEHWSFPALAPRSRSNLTSSFQVTYRPTFALRGKN